MTPREDVDADKLLTVAEVARLFQVRTSWIYMQVAANRLPHLKVGRYVRFRRSAIDAYLGKCESGR